MRISQVADAAGVNTETLRYYERRGLLPEPDRTLGGHRLYSEDAVIVLRVIKAAQRLGFSLDEVAELLAAGQHQHRTRGRASGGQAGGQIGGQVGGLGHRAAQKLAEVEAKIADLQVIASTLRAALDARCDDLMTCATNDDCCPIPFATIATIPVGPPRTTTPADAPDAGALDAETR